MGFWRALLRRTPKQVKYLLLLLTLGFLFTSFLLFRSFPDGATTQHTAVSRNPILDHRDTSSDDDNTNSKPVVWIYAKKEIAMSHVFAVFNRLGFRMRQPGEPWDVMWSHGYPFGTFKEDLQNLRPHQKINHFPGIGCVTSKPKLASHEFSFTPKTFAIPTQSDEFLKEVERRPDTLWVQKNNKHRGIKIKPPKDIPLRESGTIVQEFISNPLLIDGRKFDIGIYTLIASIDPLVVYIYAEEVLVRFCAKDYLPFNEKEKQKYVVDDDYTPSWEIPSLRPLIKKHDLSHKDALSHFLRQKGFNPDQMWAESHSIIQKVLQHCEVYVSNYTSNYVSIHNFFEMVRFDFIIDDNFRVWLMEDYNISAIKGVHEVNLSPNLSSAHTAGNRNMYEQLVYNVLHMVGVSRDTEPGLRYNGKYESVMFVNDHDITIPIASCIDGSCSDCKYKICNLCKQCRSKSLEFTLKTTFMQFVSRRNFKRLIPEPFEQCTANDGTGVTNRLLSATKWSHSKTRLNNELMEAWFYGKCCQHSQWC